MSEEEGTGRLRVQEVCEPYKVEGTAGAFYVFTSNVDAHSFDVFEANEIRECHGNVEIWQCPNKCKFLRRDGDGDSKMSSLLWRIPLNHEFVVDKNTMLAVPFVDEKTMTMPSDERGIKRIKKDNTKEGEEKGDVKAHIGHTFGSTRRQHLLKNMPNNVDLSSLWIAEASNVATTKHPIVSQPSSTSDNSSCNLVASGTTTSQPPSSDKNDNVIPPPPSNSDNPSLPTATIQPPHPPAPSPKLKSTYPKCPLCQQLARPAILMFGDNAWIDNAAQAQRWTTWKKALYDLTRHYCQQRCQDSDTFHNTTTTAGPAAAVTDDDDATSGAATNDATSTSLPLKTCILEVGCGVNVATCRVTSEKLVDDLVALGGDVTLVRINPDYPLTMFEDDEIGARTISIMAKGLESLKAIDHILEQFKQSQDYEDQSRQGGRT